jgi:hypothetical protein
MDVRTLIDLAANQLGSKAALARAMNKQPPRISEWYRGEQKPDAHEIAFLAECAGLPILETVAEIESQLDERYAHIWEKALGKLKAAGVAASFILVLQLASQPEKAEAHQVLGSVSHAKYIGDEYIHRRNLR